MPRATATGADSVPSASETDTLLALGSRRVWPGKLAAFSLKDSAVSGSVQCGMRLKLHGNVYAVAGVTSLVRVENIPRTISLFSRDTGPKKPRDALGQSSR
jgi:hypothetical protein